MPQDNNVKTIPVEIEQREAFVADSKLHRQVAQAMKNYRHAAYCERDKANPLIVAKLFMLASSATWWLTAYDPKDRIADCYVTGMFEDEWGSVFIDELASMDVRIGGSGIPAVEFDLHFEPTYFKELEAKWSGLVAREAPSVQRPPSLALPLQPLDKEASEFVAVQVETQEPQVVQEPQYDADGALVFPIKDFLKDYQSSLLDSVRKNSASLYDGNADPADDEVLNRLTRRPFDAQRRVIHAQTYLLSHQEQAAGIINAEMGTGKTLMGIGVAAVMHHRHQSRTLIIAPPHLVYKWRREIKNTIPDARVWILNGADTLRKLIQLREMTGKPKVPEFFILGRVRMRMGFNWRPAFSKRVYLDQNELSSKGYARKLACCSNCGEPVVDADGHHLSETVAFEKLSERRAACTACGNALWTLVHQKSSATTLERKVASALTQLPTIGPKTAHRLIERFGTNTLADMLADNVYEFVNLMDEKGDLVFNDRQAQRIERAFASTEISFGQGGYQPTEFIKRYLPQGYFGLLIVDEGHEYKNEGSAQGQAFGVLARKCSKVLLLTGTLMGGYADDLFYLLWRLNPQMMMQDGYHYNARGSLGAAAMAFMRNHGILRDVFKESEGSSYKTARGNNVTHSTSKRPGFSPQGVMNYILPITSFLKLKEIGGNVLPTYEEEYVECGMSDLQDQHYQRLSGVLTQALKQALVKGDRSLMGVVLNTLLAWPDCCFRGEIVRHPHTKAEIVSAPAIVVEETLELLPKEAALIEICKNEVAQKRRVLVYSIYSGTRDVQSRLQTLLGKEGLKVGVLRSTVSPEKREDWVLDQVDRGIDVMICNPELVKTGLDLLEFPTIVFMQSGYNVYTVQQAARRSWRIGQQLPVKVMYLGYVNTAQTSCLSLMSQKIAVSQSTSGDIPDSGLDILNPEGDSVEVALAKQLVEGGKKT